ncbi:MAG: peptidylprolyl isomerase [Lactobacillus sp.]|nr:peptidylprolyl isomerase [Lactobacillus sp.]
MNLNLKKLSAAVMTATVALTLAACSNEGKTMVTYKGGKITEEQYLNKVKKTQAGQQTFSQMIITNVFENQYGKKVSNADVNKMLNQYKKQYGSSFSQVLTQNGMSVATLRENIRSSLLMNAAMKDLKKISTKQEEKYWKSYQPAVTVQHILVSSKSTANNIIKQLKAGKDFATLAKKYSLDTNTKNKGGKLSSFDSTDTTLDDSFKTAAFKLKKGEYTTSPVKTQSGYEIIKMIKTGEKGTLKQNKAKIDKAIYAEMAQDSTVMSSVIKTVLTKANIKIKDSSLKNVLSSYMSTTSTTNN